MKIMKKALALLLALTLLLALATTAFAATITIDKGATGAGAEYKAYKLLNATNSEADETKFAYTLNDKYTDILKEITEKTTESEIISYIAAMTSDTVEIQKFADDVYKKIKATTPEIAADYTTTTSKFESVDQGYYLIAETETSGTQDTYSLVMLDTAGKDEVTVETKEDTPTLEKKVQEKNDFAGTTSEWQDGADYDIGDDVPFKLTGTVSDKYADYKTYYYAFHDTMSSGLSFNKDSVVVKVDGTTVTGGYEVVTEGLTDGCTFEVVFDDLKKITGATVNANSSITVEYTAELNNSAVIGDPGNPNEAKLEYNNNPYYEGTGKPTETGETPEDKVVVFTYKLNADKVDGEGEALEGAGFTLYKYIAPVAPATEGTWDAVGNEITGVTTFTFTGLDAGQYKLVETTVPAGYNKADDVLFTIEATYDTNSTDPKLTALTVKDKDGNVVSTGQDAVFSTSITDGSVNTDVANLSGVELPSTGGIGTTIFYVVGGVLMLGALILFITKKKMSAKD